MSSLNGIGYAFSDTVAEDFFENINRHCRDCPNFTELFELCDYCNRAPQSIPLNDQPADRRTRSPPAAMYGGQESHATSMSWRTYAQVVSSTTPPGLAMPVASASRSPMPRATTPFQPQAFQKIEDWMSTSAGVAAPSPAPQPDPTRLSYAQVAQQAARRASKKFPQGPVSVPQRPRNDRDVPMTGTQCDGSTPAPPTIHGNALDSIPHGAGGIFHAALQPEKHSDPRNVNTHVQETLWSSHRQSLAPGVMPHGGVSTPMSPTAVSETSFTSRRSDRRTGQALLDSTGNPYRCRHCPHRFPTRDAVRRHESIVHVKKENRRHRCPYAGCIEAFVYPKDLNRHIVAVHAGGAGPPVQFSCPYCGKSYTRDDNRNRHVRDNHLRETDSTLGSSLMSRRTSLSGGFNMSRSTSNTSFSQAYSP